MVLCLGTLGAPLWAQDRAEESGLIVRGLHFEGNEAVDDLNLAAAIATTKSSWFATSAIRFIGLGAKRRFSEVEFRRDVERLRLYYRRGGYLEVTVDTVVRRTAEDVYITFRIHEGRPVLVRRLEFLGVDSLPFRDRLLRELPLRRGRPFNRDSLRATADTIATRLQNRGYPTAAVYLAPAGEPNGVAWEVDPEARTADVVLRVDPGVPAVVGDIRVVGNTRVDSGFVVSLLATQPGRPYRQQDLFESQRNLYRSDLFRFASAAIDTSRFRAGEPVVPILVQVIEGRLHRARASAGFGSNDCFRTSAGWTERNFLGQGRILDISGQLSKIGVGDPFNFGMDNNLLCSRLQEDSVGSSKANYALNVSWRQPTFLSPSNTLTFTAFTERRSEFLVYLRNEVGASVTLAHETVSRIPLSLTYRVSYGRTEANSANFCAFFNACTLRDIDELRKRRVLALLTGTVIRERTNNPLDPTRGSVYSGEVTVSSRLLGSASLQTFTRAVGEVTYYRPITGDLVLAIRGRGGVIFAPQVSLDSGSTNFIPPDQRFYAGGPNDVRGFDRNELGPVAYVIASSALSSDPTAPIARDSVQVSPVGGNTLVVGNVELRFPSPIAGHRIRLAAFVDAGGVWERGGRVRAPARVRATPGLGMRVTTPLGPARVDVAWNPYDLESGPLFAVDETGELSLIRTGFRPDDRSRSRFTLHFSVGQAF